VHPSGQRKILELLGISPELKTSSERFDATLADAYCFYAALGRTLGASALQSLTSEIGVHINFESRIEFFHKSIRQKVGRAFRQFEAASLEAYLLTPLTGSRPKLVRLSKARNPNRAECPTCPAESTRELQSAIDLAPPVGASPATVATVLADVDPLPLSPAALVSVAPMVEAIEEPAPAVHEANEMLLADLDEASDSRFLKNGTRVRVKAESGQGNRGLHGDGIPCAVIVGYDGCGVYRVRRATADVNVQRNRERRVHGSWLVLLDEVRTVASGEDFQRNGKPDARHARSINSSEKRAKIAEAKQNIAESCHRDVSIEAAALRARNEMLEARCAEDALACELKDMRKLLAEKEEVIDQLFVTWKREKNKTRNANNRSRARKKDADLSLARVKSLEKKVERLEGERACDSAAVDRGSSVAESSDTGKPELWKLLGLRCTKYSQDVVELGLTLMAQHLSAPQARAVLRTFLRIEYPEKDEGVHYRVPGEGRFKEWRRMLEHICHHLALFALSCAREAQDSNGSSCHSARGVRCEGCCSLGRTRDFDQRFHLLSTA